jgi:plastocyanin
MTDPTDSNSTDAATQAAGLTISTGDEFRDELNNVVVEVVDVEGDVATVRADGTEWRERLRDLREKVVAGDFTPMNDAATVDGAANEAVTQRAAEFAPGDQVMWEFAGGEAHGVVRSVHDGEVSVPNGATRDAPPEGESNYVVDEWDDANEEWDERSVVKSGSELDESTADLPEPPADAPYSAARRVTTRADVPRPGDAQLLYPDRETAAAVADEIGVAGVHEHELDGETWYMPGESHDAFEDAMNQQAAVGVKADPMTNGHDLDPETGRGTCSETGKEIEAETWGDLMRDCPHCGEPLSHLDAGQKAREFAEGDAVRWSWQGEPVHGRVAEVRERATVSGNEITGEEGERDVYLIDEYDEEVEAYRRENVAKPESSLNESGKDLPPRSDDNYAAAVVPDLHTVAESDFSVRDLDDIARAFDDVLVRLHVPEGPAWATPDGAVCYRYEIPETYLEETDLTREDFVPDAAVADAARKVREWAEDHPDEFDAGGPDGELLRRADQLVDHHENDEPLALEYWREIANFHARKHAQGSHELAAEYEGEPWRDAGYAGHEGWGGDAGYEQAQRIVEAVDDVDQSAAVTMRGVAAAASPATARDPGPRSPGALTKANSNEVDVEGLPEDLQQAVAADEFYVYGKASIEQWDDDDPPTYISMDALEGALDRFLGRDGRGETAPGIISREHQDIPVGRPVESFEFAEDTTLEIDGETYEFAAGDVARSHVEDADGDGQRELWLAAEIDGTTEMGKKTRALVAEGSLNGFSVTVHRNRDEMTQEGRVVHDCDLHAVTIGTDEQIKNPGSEFDLAEFKSGLGEAWRRLRAVMARG